MSKGLGQKIAIQFTEKLISISLTGFNIKWKEHKHVDGILIDKSFIPQSIDQRDDYTIILTMHPQQRFNNVEGLITVEYSADQGGLVGRGGAVQTFQVNFQPEDLEPKPNPHSAEYLAVSSNVSISFLKVTYTKAYSDESITVSATAVVDFIHVDDINP